MRVRIETTAGRQARSGTSASPNSSVIHCASPARLKLSTRPSVTMPEYQPVMTVLGVDIGATKIAVGRVNERAEVAEPRTTPTRAADGFDVSLAQVWRAIEESLTPEVKAIGICAPGPLNPKTGLVLNPPNLPGWRDVPLAALAHERFGLPTRLENDCNAAGLA